MTSPPTVAVVGAGLAGAAAAVSATHAGADVTLFERHPRIGGASAESAGWIWRYVDLRTFRTCAPHGDPRIQHLILDRLDDGLDWLERYGAPAITRRTSRAITCGRRFDMVRVIDGLLGRLPDGAVQTRACVIASRRGARGRVIELQVERPDAAGAGLVRSWETFDAVVFAGGGYAADLDRVASEAGVPSSIRDLWELRTAQGGDGTSMDAAAGVGAMRIPADGECFARVVADGIDPLVREDMVLNAQFGELVGVAGCRLLADNGSPIDRESHDWSGSRQVWALARASGRGRLVLPRGSLRTELPSGAHVEDVLRAALTAGADLQRDPRGDVSIGVRAGLTHTICGLRVDAEARALTARRGLRRGVGPIARVFAAGCDVAGAGAGGYASGLAQALVLGRIAGAAAIAATR